MAQIALTTVYTPPTSCFDNSYTSYGTSVYVKDVHVQSSECYPDGFRSLWSLGSPFSPGVCPESYAVVASRSDRDVTTILCCPGSLTAHGEELGCYTEVDSATVLALPTGVITVENAMLAIHGVLIAWASSDLSILPAMPASSSMTLPALTASTTQSDHTSTESEGPTTPSASTSLASSVASTHTLTITPLTTITQSTTRKVDTQTTNPVDDTTPLPTSSAASVVNTSASATTTPPPHLSSGVIAGISIGAAAGFAIVAALFVSVILVPRKRRRRDVYSNKVDVRVFDTAAQFHEDKRRWSPLFLSFGTASGSGQTDVELSEADSRAVVLTISELEGNNEMRDN